MSLLQNKKRILVITLTAFVGVLVAAGVAFAMWVSSVNNQLRGEDTALVEDILVEREGSEAFYMMLIGSDARSDDSSMGARSDTNIVVRVDPQNNQITLISIPRDTMITLNGSQAKFNAAYAYEGAVGAVREASTLLGVEISHYVEVNFEMLEALVDAIGGVDVEVESTINDSNAGDVVIEAGLQQLDGEASLVFARSRAYVDGDFTRTYNQRLLVAAIVEKVLSLSITEMPTVIEAAAQCVTTDLTITDIIALAYEFKEADGELTIYSAMVPSTTGTVNGISYVFTDEETLAEMMEVVEAGGDPSGFTASPTASTSSSASSSDSSSSTSSSGTTNSDWSQDGSSSNTSSGATSNTSGTSGTTDTTGTSSDTSDSETSDELGKAEGSSDSDSGSNEGQTGDSSDIGASSATDGSGATGDSSGSTDGGSTTDGVVDGDAGSSGDTGSSSSDVSTTDLNASGD